MIKLNVGCGNKLYPSNDDVTWVNIDIVPPKKEDLCDNINFLEQDVVDLNLVKDDYGDYLFASHVVEHLKFHDVPKALKEWYRVLKPGGTMALEMPDLIKCCINVLQLETLGKCQMSEQLGIFGLYGEQDPEAPYMQHYWAWTFKTLAPFVRDAGFENVIETTPLTHMRTQRDFRLEANKPVVTENKKGLENL